MRLLLLPISLLAAQPNYVPDGGWHSGEWSGPFHEEWFGKQLKAMREPVLASADDLDGFRERFRLLVLPSSRHGYSYRIDVAHDGSARLRWTRLSGRGGYAPGRLARQGSRRLSTEEADRLQAALAAASLNSLPREENDVTIGANGEEILSICVDGTELVFEWLSAAERHYLVRNCHTEKALKELAGVVTAFKPRETMD